MTKTPTYIDGVNLRNRIKELLQTVPDMAEDEILRADMLEGETDLHDVLEAALDARDDALGMADSIKQRIMDMRERQARFMKRAQFYADLMAGVLEEANLRKLELPQATIGFRNLPAKVVITDEANIPDDFMRIKKTPDKTKIKTALKDGQEVPGTTLANGGEAFYVRTK